MLEFVTADQNTAFCFSLVLLLLIAALESVGMLIGVGFSQLFDGLLPDMDIDADIDIDGDLEGTARAVPALSSLLGWFRLGQVPILILLVVFLTCFGLMGLAIQSVAVKMVGSLLPTVISTALALVISLPCYRVTSGLIARIAPKDETSAVSDTTFIGRIATITLGVAAKDSPAEARLSDKFQQTHYIMVAPDLDDDTFRQGDQVLIVRKAGSVFRVIASDNPTLNRP